MFPLPNCLQLHRSQSLWHILLECVKSIVAVITEVFLDLSPEELDEVEFAVVFGQKDAQMPRSLDNLLYQGLLPHKVRLTLKDFLATAAVVIIWAFLALATETHWVKPTLLQDFAHAFCFSWVLWVVR